MICQIIWEILLLALSAQLGEACGSKGNGQGAGKGGLLNLDRLCNVHVCTLYNLYTVHCTLYNLYSTALNLTPLLSGLAMNSVVSRVCDNWESGTDENVLLEFKSTKSGGGDETYPLQHRNLGHGNNWIL